MSKNKKRVWRISTKHLKRIPKRYAFGIIVLLIFVFTGFKQAFFAQYESKENTTVLVAPISQISVHKPYSKWRSVTTLRFWANGQEYYIFYHDYSYVQYSAQIEQLTSERDVPVTMRVSDRKTLWDILFSRQRIVDMRWNDIVLYDMEIENTAIRTQKITGGIVGVLFLLVSIGYCLWLTLCYDIIKWRPKKIGSKSDNN